MLESPGRFQVLQACLLKKSEVINVSITWRETTSSVFSHLGNLQLLNRPTCPGFARIVWWMVLFIGYSRYRHHSFISTMKLFIWITKIIEQYMSNTSFEIPGQVYNPGKPLRCEWFSCFIGLAPVPWLKSATINFKPYEHHPYILFVIWSSGTVIIA